MHKARFSLIEAMIVKHGRVSRGHICRAFGLSEPAATRVFREYNRQHPGNLIYRPSDRAYMASDKFKAGTLKISAERFLQSAQDLAEEKIEQNNEE